MCDEGNAAKRARTYEEYRGCLIEAVPSVQSEPTDVLLRTGYGTGFTPDGFLNLSRIT